MKRPSIAPDMYSPSPITSELNQLLMQRWGDVLDTEKVFGWVPSDSPTKEDQLTGQAVFGDLSRPALISSELLQGESSFETVNGSTA